MGIHEKDTGDNLRGNPTVQIWDNLRIKIIMVITGYNTLAKKEYINPY